MLNKYPLWKNLLLIVLICLGFIYAAPNIFGEDPAVQVSGVPGVEISDQLLSQIDNTLQTNHLNYKSAVIDKRNILVRFNDTDTQLKASDILKASLGDNYTVALNLAPATPSWLIALGAQPMKLGLDLRGGVHFLLDVDIDSVVGHRQEGNISNITSSLHDNLIRYADIELGKDNIITLTFRDENNLEAAQSLINRDYQDLVVNKNNVPNTYQLYAQLSPAALQKIDQYTIDQTMTTLRNRVNELGVSEAVVQQQGLDRVSVDLPGIQDTAHAKEILGGTATLEFHMVDQDHDAHTAAASGIPPAGSKLYTWNDEGRSEPILLKDQIILTGNSITDATATFDENGRPSVDINLGGGGENLFSRVTRENIGKLMSVVFVESKIQSQLINGKVVKTTHKNERIISVATIQNALGAHFQITGLTNEQESQNLALLLRAGALPAAIDYEEERTVGPSLGQENIHKGILSVEVGMLLVGLFMAVYYRLFGVIADVALTLNLVLLVALLSILGATLTLPGIAGIVLTVGMAVDANVLIFERIREELRNGLTPQASIHAGYERALVTIVDANVTSLIVAMVLFGIGTDAVKGFAVTLTLGLLTSMFSAIMVTRALINAIYGGRAVKGLSIGI